MASMLLLRLERGLLLLTWLIMTQSFAVVRTNGQWLQSFSCPSAIFNFGDSLSDTGNAAIAFPYTSNVHDSPYGTSYFPHPAGRFSDGRLLLDFIAQAFSFPLLPPYLQSFSPDLRRGANFAYAGATAGNDTSFSPFSLLAQVDQFLGFKQRTFNAQLQPGCTYCPGNLPQEEIFGESLYIVSIGGNDLTTAYFRSLSIFQVLQNVVPEAVASIYQSVLTLYNSGARSFMIFNVPAEGCSALFLNDFEAPGVTTDNFGCLQDYNDVVQELNKQLYFAILALRIRLFDASIIHVDYYAANMDVLSNPGAYGMLDSEKLNACCGVGGQHNFDPSVSCGSGGFLNGSPVFAGPCPNPKQYVNWDGIHFTEAFYKGVAKQILNGSFVDPPINLVSACGLNFYKFEDPSFETSYPGVAFM
ncbi:unnamed protein product [Calypogeia fissa]